jgi:hypothetical protein
MPTTAILFLSKSHDHVVSLATSGGPIAMMTQVSGYLLILVAAALVVACIESVSQRG